MSEADLALAERETNNLRQHLLWAAHYLSPAERIELRDRIAAPIAEGGVVADQAADDRAENLERESAIEALVDHIQVAVDIGASDAWIAKADVLANRLRGYLRPARYLTFHELKNPEAAHG